MQIQTNPQSRFRVTFEIHFGPHSVEGSHFLMSFLSFFGAGDKIVDWSPFSLAQRRIASREREKVILIWGQTGCLNLRLFKMTTFFHVRDRIPSRERKPHHILGAITISCLQKNPAKWKFHISVFYANKITRPTAKIRS